MSYTHNDIFNKASYDLDQYNFAAISWQDFSPVAKIRHTFNYTSHKGKIIELHEMIYADNSKTITICELNKKGLKHGREAVYESKKEKKNHYNTTTHTNKYAHGQRISDNKKFLSNFFDTCQSLLADASYEFYADRNVIDLQTHIASAFSGRSHLPPPKKRANKNAPKPYVHILDQAHADALNETNYAVIRGFRKTELGSYNIKTSLTKDIPERTIIEKIEYRPMGCKESQPSHFTTLHVYNMNTQLKETECHFSNQADLLAQQPDQARRTIRKAKKRTETFKFGYSKKFTNGIETSHEPGLDYRLLETAQNTMLQLQDKRKQTQHDKIGDFVDPETLRKLRALMPQ